MSLTPAPRHESIASPFQTRRGRPWNDEMQVKSLFDQFVKSKGAAGRSENTLRQYHIALKRRGPLQSDLLTRPTAAA